MKCENSQCTIFINLESMFCVVHLRIRVIAYKRCDFYYPHLICFSDYRHLKFERVLIEHLYSKRGFQRSCELKLRDLTNFFEEIRNSCIFNSKKVQRHYTGRSSRGIVRQKSVQSVLGRRWDIYHCRKPSTNTQFPYSRFDA